MLTPRPLTARLRCAAETADTATRGLLLAAAEALQAAPEPPRTVVPFRFGMLAVTVHVDADDGHMTRDFEMSIFPGKRTMLDLFPDCDGDELLIGLDHCLEVVKAVWQPVSDTGYIVVELDPEDCLQPNRDLYERLGWQVFCPKPASPE